MKEGRRSGFTVGVPPSAARPGSSPWRRTARSRCSPSSAAQLAGVLVDVVLHARDSTLAAREDPLTLANPGHALIAAGPAFTALTLAAGAAHRISRRLELPGAWGVALTLAAACTAAALPLGSVSLAEGLGRSDERPALAPHPESEAGSIAEAHVDGEAATAASAANPDSARHVPPARRGRARRTGRGGDEEVRGHPRRPCRRLCPDRSGCAGHRGPLLRPGVRAGRPPPRPGAARVPPLHEAAQRHLEAGGRHVHERAGHRRAAVLLRTARRVGTGRRASASSAAGAAPSRPEPRTTLASSFQ